MTHGDAGDEDGDHSRNCDRVIKEHGGLVAARSEMIFCCCFICYFPFFSHRHNSQSREGVSCAAVLLVRLAPPYPCFTRVGGGAKNTIFSKGAFGVRLRLGLWPGPLAQAFGHHNLLSMQSLPAGP